MKAKVGIFKVEDDLKQGTEEALKALNWKQHIREKVFLKPNLCSPTYVAGAVTNPQLIHQLILTIRDHAEEIIVGESDGYYYSSEEAFSKTGVGKAVEKAGGKTVNLTKDEMVEIKNPDLSYLKTVRLPKTLVEADSIVSVPVLKTHEFSLFSGAIKNLFGCIPSNRRILHHPHINEVLSDLIHILKPTFSIMDATIAMEGNGPGRGIPVKMGLLLASANLLALDRTAADLICIDWTQVGHLKHISQLSKNENIDISIIGEKFDDVKRPFIRPYLDLAVKIQLRIYKSYLLTYLCFNTPIFNVLNAAAKVFRVLNRRVKGEELLGKHWSTTN